MTIRELLCVILLGTATVQAQNVAQFTMSLHNGVTTEMVSGQTFTVQSALPAFTVKGVKDDALRFDGYSNYVRAALPANINSEQTSLTVNVILAAETYPMVKTSEAEITPTYVNICGNLDEAAKTGVALMLSSQGDLKVRYSSAYRGGYITEIKGNTKLPMAQWNLLSFVFDKTGGTSALYLNGNQIASGKTLNQGILLGTAPFYIGKDATDITQDHFLLNTFCGLIDDISIALNSTSPDEFKEIASTLSAQPNFAYPASRYEQSVWRPQFHGMPTGGWTNETHGLTYSDGRYHVFFQKNANGPYMARLHWGHISSENLYKWHEEPIAIAPGEAYDIKGCWSGCVYDDGALPSALYTAVDNARATIVKAHPTDATLTTWVKDGIQINGRPSGLSDDFRDPYHFTANGHEYIIVGTSKGGVGACTLHRLEGGFWTNDGSIFFRGTNTAQHGSFWEMPNVTPMGNGQWLFTCTPLNTSLGVRTLCWIGTIGDDGTFTPTTANPQYLEMGGISRDGYGLLSPSIFQHEGKTLLLGIVPDKLPTANNYDMGWAHTYSLPRTLSVDAYGNMVQKPYDGLTGMRTNKAFREQTLLNGALSVSPVGGHQLELLGKFVVTSGQVGFHFLKKQNEQATLSYDVASGQLTLDFTQLQRTINDRTYGGVYTVTLPEKVGVGEVLTLHLYLDGSIVDIFVNERWAFSARVFPTDATAIEAEAFASTTTEATISAWVLDADNRPMTKGDVNGDGIVDAVDLEQTVGCAINNTYSPAADLDNDETVDINDVSLLIAILKKNMNQ